MRLSLHTQPSKTPAHTVALVIVRCVRSSSSTSVFTNCWPDVAATTGRLPPQTGVPKPPGQIGAALSGPRLPTPTLATNSLRNVFRALPSVDPSSPRSHRGLWFTGQQECVNRRGKAWTINGLAGGRLAFGGELSSARVA